MKYLITIVSLCFALCGSAHAQLTMSNVGAGGFGAGGTPPLTCTEGTAFVARALIADPTYNTLHQDAINNLICGLVATSSTISGTLWSRTSALYATATQSAAVAVLNLKSSSYTLTAVAGPITYTTDRCFAYNGTTQYHTTGFSPFHVADGIFTQNNAHLDTIITSSSTSPSVETPVGASTTGGVALTYILPLTTGPIAQGSIDGGAFPSIANSNTKARYVISRTASNSSIMYVNASPGSTATGGTSGFIDRQIYVGAFNSNNTAIQFFTGCISAVGWGAGLSSTDVTAYDALWVAYLTAVGALP